MREDSPRGRSWTVRVYQVLLLAYDRQFRERHGAEMLRLFVERERDAGRAGRRWWFLAGAAADALRSGLGTRLDTARKRRAGVGAGTPMAAARKRDQRGGGGMDSLMKDARYAVRSLLKSPGFAGVAVLTIGLGIGANTAIFSVVRAVLLQPLPYEDSGELVMVWGEMRNRDVLHFPSSPPDFRDLREQADLLEDMAAVSTFSQSLTGDGDPVQVDVGFVTDNFFGLLGVEPVLGRDFVPEDATPNEPDVQPGSPGALPGMVLLSHSLWQQRYGGASDVLGATLELGGATAEIVGVMPPGFELLLPPHAALAPDVDLWMAARIDYENAPRNNVFLRPVARLRDGVSVQQAQAQVDRIAASFAAEDQVKSTAGYALRLEPLQADLTAHVRPVLLALFGAVVFVLLIACANVSNLLLVRSAARDRELAVRAAMGGSRGRLVRQLLLESLALSLAGALVGLLLAAGGIELLLALKPQDLPRIADVGIDGTVLGFTLLAAFLAAAFFGIVPALQASRLNLADSLKDRGSTALGAGSRTIRNIVVVGEVALSMVLLIGAGLMVRSFVRLSAMDPGYQAEGLLTFDVSLPFAKYPQPIDRANLLTDLQRRLEGIPGVESAAAGFPLPLSGQLFNGRYGPEEALTDPEAFRQAAYRFVLPGYFETMGTRVLEGRTFSEADHADSALVVVVDEKLARNLWPAESAVGRRFLIRAITPEPEWVEVIGVVEHQRAETLAADGMEAVYFTDRYAGSFAGSWAVRAAVDPLSLTGAVRAELAALDGDLPVANVRTMKSYVDEAMGPTRFSLTLIGVFGIIALMLASVGLYGVLAYVVRHRTAEIGVRMAFGAERGSILNMVVRQGLLLAGAGVLLGVLVAFPLTQVMETMLVGVSPTDPLTFVGISAIFVAVAAAACLVPARRATRVDPVMALREE